MAASVHSGTAVTLTLDGCECHLTRLCTLSPSCPPAHAHTPEQTQGRNGVINADAHKTNEQNKQTNMKRSNTIAVAAREHSEHPHDQQQRTPPKEAPGEERVLHAPSHSVDVRLGRGRKVKVDNILHLTKVDAA
jgi:hypothetical protein